MFLGHFTATGETDPDMDAFYGLGVASGASLFVERFFDAERADASKIVQEARVTHSNGRDVQPSIGPEL